MNKWLPPLDVCCDKAKITIMIHSNLTVHFGTRCEEHGIKGINSPFSKSLMDYEIIVSKKLGVQDKNYSKEQRKLWNQDKT